MRDLMFVGGYTRQSPHVTQAAAEGIVAVTWDRQRQSFGVLGVTPGYDNPSWLAFDPMHHRFMNACTTASMPSQAAASAPASRTSTAR